MLKNKNDFSLTPSDRKYLKIHKSLLLQIELIPHTCWYLNIRSNIKKKYWDLIRYNHYEKANYKCEICGKPKSKNSLIHCHEVWHYHDKLLLQRLKVFQALCPLCHEVKHFGFAKLSGNEKRAFRRFKRLNNIDTDTAREIISAVFKQWRIRSEQKWSFNISILKKYGIDPDELYLKKRKKVYFK